MSFRCYSCKEAQPDKERPIKTWVVTAKDRYGDEVWGERDFCAWCATAFAANPANSLPKQHLPKVKPERRYAFHHHHVVMSRNERARVQKARAKQKEREGRGHSLGRPPGWKWSTPNPAPYDHPKGYVTLADKLDRDGQCPRFG